jgi:hypothetical protein
MHSAFGVLILNILQSSAIILFTLILEQKSGLIEVGKFSYVQGFLAPISVLMYFNLRLQVFRQINPMAMLPQIRGLIYVTSILLFLFGLLFNSVDYFLFLVVFKIGESIWVINSALWQKQNKVALALVYQAAILLVFFISTAYLGDKALVYLGVLMIVLSVYHLKGQISFKWNEVYSLIKSGTMLGINSLLELLTVSVLRILSLRIYGADVAGAVSIELIFFLPISLITMSIGHQRLISENKNVASIFKFIWVAVYMTLGLVYLSGSFLIDYEPLKIAQNSVLKLALIIPVLIVSSRMTYDLIHEKLERVLLRSSIFGLSILFVFFIPYDSVRNNIVFIVYGGFFFLRIIYLKTRAFCMH